ncbi:WD repeat- and FYVE domain-containing protein 4 [Merluccius polli]|uniref:WD repeat- and FYVE domain-containing protein 4 n=1 Tax=Merluccius polli TaxID=89951 RepID=A0AA47LZU8_MERPO|nr:WD repeat- and FYVE domain-containing protein 4 [Merluccius polli]
MESAIQDQHVSAVQQRRTGGGGRKRGGLGGGGVKAKHCVLVVSGHRLTEGVLLFGKESVYLCESFTLSPAGDVCCRKHHPSRYSPAVAATLMLSMERHAVMCGIL